MSFTTLDSIQWGGVPHIGVSFAYDSQRSGSAMLYRVKVTVAPLTGASYFGYPIYLGLYVAGSTVTSGYTLKSASPNRWSSAITYDSGWVTTYPSGSTASLSIRLYSGSGSTRDDTYGYALPVERVESIGDFALSAGDVTLGRAGTVTVTRPGYGYSFSFTYSFGGSSGAVSVTTVSSSAGRVTYQWTAPESLAARLPYATWGSGTLTARVYSGGSYIGSVSDTFTAYVPDSMRPTASVTATVVNDNTVLQGWGLCVQGMSRVQYSVSAAAQGGASVDGCHFRFAGQETTALSGTTGTVSVSGYQIPTATVTDSRGRSVTASGSAIQVHEYAGPVITASAAVRCDAGGTEQDDGAYLKVKCAATCSSLGGRNTVAVRARFRPMGGSWSGYTTLAAGTFQLLGGGLEPTRSYEVELSAVDTVGSVRTVRYTAATGQVTLHLRSGGSGAAFGKYAELDALECAWPAVFYGSVAVSGGLTVGGETVEGLLFPVGSVRWTASAAAPETAGMTWQQVNTGLTGVYAWKRVS